MVFTRHRFVKSENLCSESKEPASQTQNDDVSSETTSRVKRRKTEDSFLIDNKNAETSEVVSSKEVGLRRSSRQNKTMTMNEFDSSDDCFQESSTRLSRRSNSGRLKRHSNISGYLGAGVGKGGKHRSQEISNTVPQTSCADDEDRSHDVKRSSHPTDNLSEGGSEKETGDMYTRIKRMRRAASLRAEGQLDQSIRISRRHSNGHKKSSGNNRRKEVEEDSDEDDNNRRYPVRERRQAELFSANRDLYRPRRQEKWFNESFSSPKKSRSHSYHRHRRKRRASNSSTTSSSSSSSDEARFERRKAKSMQRSRSRFLPINFTSDDIKSGMLHAKNKSGGASLADVDPMIIDDSVTFDCVGGLTGQIQALKEAVVLPLVYPEVFSHLSIEAPKGILFYGPPGTGKTLLARALSNECGKLGQRVAFFMRKGADCLSKWVGESERQLRLLFDQAFRMRPSIIFFDEIDGLAPVRSSKQDQIHASIVSTLLGLIDGLDARGHVVVIGATNRLDSIDPALRRPGRFDREFFFPLPSEKVRGDIMRLAVSSWKPPLPESIVETLAKKTQGFTGADLKALTREAGLCALRRRYPQIYSAKEKLLLKLSEIKPQEEDFVAALSVVRPSGQRSANTLFRPLPYSLCSLLSSSLEMIYQSVQHIFPAVSHRTVDAFSRFTTSNNNDEVNEDYSLTLSGVVDNDLVQSLSDSINLQRPRLLVHGPGLSDHLMAAVLHRLDGVQVFPMDLTSLYTSSTSSVEECISLVMINAQRASPSVVYFPHLDRLLLHVSDTAKHCLIALITQSVSNPTAQVLILATSSVASPDQSDDEFPDWSSISSVFIHNTLYLTHPEANSRREYFSPLFTTLPLIPPSSVRNFKRQKQLQKWHSEILPLAPPPPPRKLSKEELREIMKEEDAILRELRMSLRQLIASLARDQRFKVFLYPVDQEEVPDYYDIISRPMDLSQIKTNIDLHIYTGLGDFMKDIEQICNNALEYNPVTEVKSREIRHRACDLRDTAIALSESLVDSDLIKRCQKVLEARAARASGGQQTEPVCGEDVAKMALSQYNKQRDKSLQKSIMTDYLAGPTRQVFTSYHHKDQSRCSKRLMGKSPVFSNLEDFKKAPRKSDNASTQEDADSQVSTDKPDNEDEKKIVQAMPPSPTRSTRSQTKSNSPIKSPTQNLLNGVDIDSESVTKNKSPTKSKSDSPMKIDRTHSPTKPTTSLYFNGDDTLEDIVNESVSVISNQPPSKKCSDDNTANHLINGAHHNSSSLINKKEGTVVVNEKKLLSQLDHCVASTNKWSVCRLEELYTALACCLNQYKNSWNRMTLNDDYDRVFRSFN